MSAWLETLRGKRLPLVGSAVVVLLGGWMLWSLFAPHRDPIVEAIRKRGYPVSLAELDAWYPSVPQAENVALIYTNVLGLLTNSSGPITNFIGTSCLPLIGRRLPSYDVTRLKAVLAENQAALRLLYSVPASGRSRYPIRLGEGFAVRLPHLDRMNQAVSLLTAEGLMHASEGDAERSALAFLAAGRLADSLAEEPVIYSQMVRLANWGSLLPCLERALSLTAFTEGQLALLQQMVESAERPRATLRAWAWHQGCGLRAFTDRKARDWYYAAEGRPLDPAIRLDLSLTDLTFLRLSGLLAKDKALYCDRIAQHLAAWELPYPARLGACKQLAAITNMPGYAHFFSRTLLPNLGWMYPRDANHTALVRVATAALAIERFRLAHGDALPGSLEELVPAFCKAVPADPIDGKPLRYKTHGGSYVVYSIGTDGQDDGGVAWDSNYTKVPQDVSFVVKH